MLYSARYHFPAMQVITLTANDFISRKYLAYKKSQLVLARD